MKESIFNIVQFDIEGRKVLDLFAGTGQLGIEALSRGAEECVFVDISPDSLSLVRENLRRCGAAARTERCSSLEFLRKREKFDLIFLDPPYDSGLLGEAISLIVEFDILTPGGIMICESRRDAELPFPGTEYGEVKKYRYGKIMLSVITRSQKHADSDLPGQL